MDSQTLNEFFCHFRILSKKYSDEAVRRYNVNLEERKMQKRALERVTRIKRINSQIQA